MEDLVGVPFAPRGRTREGLDCWGLHRLAVLLETGVDLPSYADLYVDAAESAENARLIAGLMSGWGEVPAGSEKRLDVVLMRVGRYACHVGTVLRPGRMLHTYSGGAVRIGHYRTGLFKDRVVGFFRHS